jgi:hypothetical protein
MILYNTCSIQEKAAQVFLRLGIPQQARAKSSASQAVAQQEAEQFSARVGEPGVRLDTTASCRN